MGTSHYRSDIVAKAGTETISGFATISATSLKGALTGNVTGNVTGDVNGATVDGDVVIANNRIKVGSHQYIFFGGLNTEASIVAVATAVDASCKGSLYMSSGGGNLWVFDSDTAATRLS